jgi:hypothetical protein
MCAMCARAETKEVLADAGAAACAHAAAAAQSGTLDTVRDISRALAATSWPPEEECGACVQQHAVPTFLSCVSVARESALLARYAFSPSLTLALPRAEIVVAPSLLHAHLLEEGLGGAARRVLLGTQNCYAGAGGAHTGEVRARSTHAYPLTRAQSHDA